MNAPVFDAWRGKPLDDALYECRELYEDAAFPTVRRWREAGASAEEIARWSAAWLSRPSTNPRRAQCR